MTRAQLEALAAGNPRVAERLRAGHYEHRLGLGDDSEPMALDGRAAGEHRDHPGRREADSGRHTGGQQPGGWPAGATATGADLAEIDGELHLILWADGADEEHPTIAIPVSEQARQELETVAARHASEQDQHDNDDQDDDQDDVDADDQDDDVYADDQDEDGVLEVEPVVIYGYDMDRPRRRERGLWGLGPENGDLVLDEKEQPGRVNLELVDAHERQVLVRLSAGQANFIAGWLTPPDGLVPLPEFAINADGGELRHSQGAA